MNKLFYNNNQENSNEVTDECSNSLRDSGYYIFDESSIRDIDILGSLLEKSFGSSVKHCKHSHNESPNIVIISNDNLLYDNVRRPQSTPEHQSLHADGVYELKPPRIVAFFCLKPSFLGGDSLLIDSKMILEKLLTTHPEKIWYLFKKDCYTIVRGEKEKTNPVFYVNKESNTHFEIGCRYSDHEFNDVLVSSECILIYNIFKELVNSEEALKIIRLHEGQGIIIMNDRVLHGRKSWIDNHSNKRKVARYWLNGKSSKIDCMPQGFLIQKSPELVAAIRKAYSYMLSYKFLY
jgi:Taurine catabolism dioxygenase TauD, TfdA family